MKKISRFLNTYTSDINVFFILACFVSIFFYGHAVESLTVLGFVVFSLLLLFFKIASISFSSKTLWTIIGYYIFIIISGIWSFDRSLYVDKIILKSTLLAIPFVFLVTKGLKETMFQKMTQYLTAILLLSTVYVLVHLVFNFQSIVSGLEQGSPIPVPMRSHVRYSILIAFGLLISLQQFNVIYFRKNKISILWLSIVLFYVIFLHILAVKVGIVMCYIILIIFSIHKILQTKKFFIGAWILAVFLTLSLLVLTHIPTLKSKIGYFKYDISMLEQNKTRNYSDSERIISMKMGIEVIKKHWILGVGEGGIYKFPLLQKDNKEWILPHNQFIMTWASYGLIGLLLLCAIFIFCIFKSIKERNWLLFAFTCCIFFAFMIEPMLETQIGVLMFVLPLCIVYGLKFVHK